ncbi:MAG: HAMP domain-containing histidine kinase [Candidatus Nomurabacteria bacterium]|jgi:signal transduction histidine kinase|nr:HAMP domain-containing histidine kinase [Candidatus Nomurabacteria bacterium]
MAVDKDKAVETQVTKIQGYWSAVVGRAAKLVIASQLFIVLIAIIFMVLAINTPEDSDMLGTVGVGVVIALEVLVQTVVIYVLLSPEKRLFDFISKVALNQDDNLVTLNHRWDETSGLKAIATFIQDIKNTSAAAAAAAEVTSRPSVDYLLGAFETTSVGFIIMDSDLNITYHNSAAPVLDGYNNESGLDLLFDGEDTVSDWVKSLKDKAVKADRSWTRVSNIPDDNQDKERKYYDVIASFASGNEAETVLVTVDHSEDYGQDEDDLQLIAFAAHELRGPVTVIRGYVDILLDEMGDSLDPEDKQLLDRLTVSVNRLSSYINNILNTSRYDQRHLQVTLSPQNIKTVTNSIDDDVALRANSQGRLLTINVPDDLPLVAADISGLGEVLTNLVDNAIKYSREGGSIEVAASTKGDTVNISITDHGIGMPASVVNNLFKKFYRSYRSRGSATGTGIGLYISKAIVEQHGGSLSVRSREGEGSTFTITLPTYDSIKDKLKTSSNFSEQVVRESSGWIKNHGTRV